MEASIRFGFFFAVFLILVLLESLSPRRSPVLSRRQRWPGAAGLLVTSAALARLAVPAGLAGIATWADGQGVGLFNHWDAPGWIIGALSLAVLDLSVWAQHLAMHRIPLFWRLHRVHHSDPHIDVVTALRFHPVEILISLGWKALIVVAFGIPAWAAFCFEVALNAFAQFNHTNWALPGPVDRVLRLVVVTPDMHRVHHSLDSLETNRNFGFCLSLWDRLFRLYKAEPDAGHAGMTIGQPAWRGASDQRVQNLLVQPFQPAPVRADRLS